MCKESIILMLTTLVIMAGCVNKSTYDFKKLHWGDDKATVINSEEKKPSFNTPTMVVFDSSSIGDYSCILAYIFENDSLQTAQYRVRHHTDTKNGNGPLVYANLKELLTEKYGSPDEEEGEDYETLRSEWIFKKTKVSLQMEILNAGYINSESFITLVYYDTNAIEKDEREQKFKKQEEKKRTLQAL